MFEYTRAFGQKLVNDFKTANYIFNILSPLIYILYLVYAILVPVGYVWANIPLLCVTLAYLVFYLLTYDIKSKEIKKTKRDIKHIYKGIKLFIGAMTLGITFYGIYTTTTHTTTLSVVLSCFMAIFWLISTVIEILTYIIQYEWSLFIASIEADAKKLIKPITATRDFFARSIGKEPEQQNAPKGPKKILRVLDKTIEKMRENKKNKRIRFAEKSESNASEENETVTK